VILEVDLESVARPNVGTCDVLCDEAAESVPVARCVEVEARVANDNNRPRDRRDHRPVEVELHVVLDERDGAELLALDYDKFHVITPLFDRLRHGNPQCKATATQPLSKSPCRSSVYPGMAVPKFPRGAKAQPQHRAQSRDAHRFDMQRHRGPPRLPSKATRAKVRRVEVAEWT
jgi:hypothetical protein